MSGRDILSLNALNPHDDIIANPALRAAVMRRHATFGTDSVLFYKEPLQLAKAEGVWLEDVAGARYLDAYNNVPSVGHCHPHIVEAVMQQASRLNIHTRYLNQGVESYAERLLATMPRTLCRLTLTCTGSESNDLALRIAQSATGRCGFIVTRGAYHGNTAAVTDISPSARTDGRVGAHVRVIDPPIANGQTDEELAHSFAASVVAAIESLEASNAGFAGFIADTVFSSDGIYPDPPGALMLAAEAVRRAGGVFIADEVQPGFGRTGTMWGFQRRGLVPDIVTMGKPMGNGYPVAGVALRADLLDRFTREIRYFNTFGGSSSAVAAGAAVLDVLEDEDLLTNASEVGSYMLEGLRALAKRHHCIADVRGAGLYLGVEVVSVDAAHQPDGRFASTVIETMRHKQVLIGAAGLSGNVLKLRPPLCFSKSNADQLIEALDQSLLLCAELRTS